MQGIEECSICYCILHTNNELPKRTCRTCKKKFHDACLVRRSLSMNDQEWLIFYFSFVGFDHRINRPVHIVERTFKFSLFSLFDSLFRFYINTCHVLGVYFHTKNNQEYSSVIDSFMSVDKAKESAAHAAVDEQIHHVGNVHIIGVGSGSTIIPAVKRISELVKKDKLDLICVPTSSQARELILSHGLKLGSLLEYQEVSTTDR